MIHSILLQAAAAMLEELKERLSHSFEVQMVSDVFTEHEEVECNNWARGKADVLASWKIENVAKRNERIAAAEAEQSKLKELADIERFEEVFGCPLEVFVKAATKPDAKKATGPAPSPHTRPDRISRKLKKDGYGRMTLGTVEYCRAILQRHLPDLVPPSVPPPQRRCELDRREGQTNGRSLPGPTAVEPAL